MAESEASAARGETAMTVTLPVAPRVMAALVGIAVPFLVFGRAVTAVLLIVAVLCVFFLPQRDGCLRSLVRQARTPIGIMVGVTLALWLPGVVFSLDPLRSVLVWTRMIFFVGAAALIWAAFVEDARMPALALRALLAGTAIMLAVSLVALFVAPEVLSFVRAKGWRAADAVLGLKGFASAAMLLVPVVLWSGVRLGGKWVSCAVAEALGLLVIIGDTISRSAIAGSLAMLTVAGVMVVWSRRQRRVTVLAGLAMGAVIIAVLVWLYTHPMSPPGAEAPWGMPLWVVDFHRQSIWKFTFNVAMDSPWFGHGINMINYVAGAFDQIPGYAYIYIPAHPHNWVLEVLAETGVVGLAPLVVLMAMMVARLARGYLRTGDPAVLAATAVAIGYWVSGLFNFSFWSAWWQVSFMVLLALCHSHSRQPSVSSFRTPPVSAPDNG